MKEIKLCSLCKGDGQIKNEITQRYMWCPVCGGMGIEETEVRVKQDINNDDDNDKNRIK